MHRGGNSEPHDHIHALILCGLVIPPSHPPGASGTCNRRLFASPWLMQLRRGGVPQTTALTVRAARPPAGGTPLSNPS